MKKVILVFMLSSLIAGCGMGSNEAVKQNQTGDKSEIAAGELAPSLSEKEPLLFEYKVKNQTEKEISLEFTSSQRFDYSVLDSDGKEIYLFSSVALYLQEMGEEDLQQGEELVYDIDLKDLGLKTGEYEVKAWMTPKDGKEFVVSKVFIIK
ncbi:BsuPI-related putative proteinase inhibitor [Bacillus sp. DJP31]|uniref:BsuPI-related putative proteinase inhibitor n=1 Tax=Bacillus sp. DJP31 TaxID=3409789 RepID=UPI003BB78A9E